MFASKVVACSTKILHGKGSKELKASDNLTNASRVKFGYHLAKTQVF